MNCLKCGRETQNEAVFCQYCLTEMEKYPIDPDYPVKLPQRKESFIPKQTTKRRGTSAEEQMKPLRKAVIILSIIVALCLVAIAFMVKPTVYYFMNDHYAIGQNYTSVISTTTATDSSVK